MNQFNSRRVTVPGIPNLAKAICFVVFALAAVAAVAQTSGQAVTASIDASKTGKTAISPYLYGQFVEHAGGLVYSSLWSEMLDDRKFYYAVGPAPAPAPRRRAERWRCFRAAASARDGGIPSALRIPS